jgi:hypothetical protein
MEPRNVRLCAVIVAVGGLAWSYGWLQAGVLPEGAKDQIEIWTSGLFQLGLVALLAIMRATRATGTSRSGRIILNAEVVALSLAIAWTIPHLFDANRPHTGILVALDAFWPISMLGLIVVGIQVIRARRWPTPVLYLPLAASLLLPIDIVVMAFATDRTQLFVRALYLAVAYLALGVGMFRQLAPSTAPGQPLGSTVAPTSAG